MKKEYQQPQVKKVVFVECSHLICDSKDNESEVNAQSEDWGSWDEQ